MLKYIAVSLLIFSVDYLQASGAVPHYSTSSSSFKNISGMAYALQQQRERAENSSSRETIVYPRPTPGVNCPNGYVYYQPQKKCITRSQYDAYYRAMRN